MNETAAQVTLNLRLIAIGAQRWLIIHLCGSAIRQRMKEPGRASATFSLKQPNLYRAESTVRPISHPWYSWPTLNRLWV